jgi:predicted acetyltransferase
MQFRFAAGTDAPLLATMNFSLIRDVGLPNRLTVAALEQRLCHWLADRYQAVIFETGEYPLGYALFRDEPEHVYLRQFFVVREHRRHGIGRAALAWLKQNVWSGRERIRLDVLPENRAAIAFWHSVGFSDLTITMEANLADDAAGKIDQADPGKFPAERSSAKNQPANTLRRVA